MSPARWALMTPVFVLALVAALKIRVVEGRRLAIALMHASSSDPRAAVARWTRRDRATYWTVIGGLLALALLRWATRYL